MLVNFIFNGDGSHRSVKPLFHHANTLDSELDLDRSLNYKITTPENLIDYLDFIARSRPI